MLLCSGKQWLSNSHLALSSALAKEGLGCLWLRGPCCLLGGLRGLRPTPNMFSFRENGDSAVKGLVRTCPSNPPLRQLGRNPARPILRHGKKRASESYILCTFREKADLAGKVLVCIGPSNPPFASWGETQLVLILDTGKSALREAAFSESKLCSGNQPQPQCFFAQESNGCPILT